jgi:peptidoglycan-N-acetylglucosamine deacetylase
MSSTGGQAGRTWRLIAVAAVVAFGTWVAGDNGSDAPAQSSAAVAQASPAARDGRQPRAATRARQAAGATALRQSGRRRDRVKVLYLTFDDGPSGEWTPQVLATLKRYDAKATFFQLGRARRAYPRLARRIKAGGHAIANHTTTHRDLTTISNGAIRWEVRNGPSSPCFRPPYGAINERVRNVLRSEGVRRIVLWDIDTLDWTRPGAHRIARRVVKAARPGKIVLLHDGGADRSQTVDALDIILRELYAKGYVFRALDC